MGVAVALQLRLRLQATPPIAASNSVKVQVPSLAASHVGDLTSHLPGPGYR